MGPAFAVALFPKRVDHLPTPLGAPTAITWPAGVASTAGSGKVLQTACKHIRQSQRHAHSGQQQPGALQRAEGTPARMHAANAASARLLHLPTNRLAALRALAGARRGAAVMAAPAASGGAAAAAADGPASAAAGARPKVLVLTGPTAVGKTKASLALAEALGGEIISADSVQVYRRLDIGSDKVR